MIQTHHRTATPKGLSSITTLLTTPGASLLIDHPFLLIDHPFLLADAQSTIHWIKSLTPHAPTAIFLTHHHPDHFFSANPILAAFPDAKFYAAPYVCSRINAEYDQKAKYWPAVLGTDAVPAAPRKPDPYLSSFFLLDGSPVVLLGPVQGDCVDQTVFWVPESRTVVAGDVVFGRSVHVWVEELESPALVHSWLKTLDMIDHLHPQKIIPGHMEEGWELDVKADLDHTRRYLRLFAEKVTYASGSGGGKPSVQELYDTFREAFPECRENLEFFLGHMANRFGQGERYGRRIGMRMSGRGLLRI